MDFVPATPRETSQMCQRQGLSSVRELYADIPDELLMQAPPDIGPGLSEMALLREMRRMASENTVYEDVFTGAGAYRHFIPAAVDALASREEFVTAYTPYQPEMSQGILQSIFEFQTMICELTGMDAANASVYDGATAAAEACLMTRERNRDKVLIAGTVSPQTLQTIQTYLIPAGMEPATVGMSGGAADFDDLLAKLDDQTAAVLVTSPNYYGIIEDVQSIAEVAHKAGAKLIVSVNPTACGLLKSPGSLGADIAVGEGQPLGIPLSFGGPYLGFMACTEKLLRKLPGRIVGQTTDAKGRRAFVLTLQAREQHIRREKAGSNICSNQAWCALRSAIYMSLMGPQGLKETAQQCWANAHYMQKCLDDIGYKRVHGKEFFHEFVTECPGNFAQIQSLLDTESILGGLPLGNGTMLWCATELTGKAQIDRLIRVMKGAKA